MLEESENGRPSDHLNSKAEMAGSHMPAVDQRTGREGFTQVVNLTPQAEESHPELAATAADRAARRIPPAQLMELPRRQLRRSNGQIRAESTDLEVLSESLDAHGMLYPIFVVRTGEYLDDGKELHDILDGQRRFDASEGRPGFDTLRCFVLEPGIEASDFVCIQLLANANRADLSPADQARAVFGLYKKSKCKSVNEFVESDHHLPFKSVWLGYLLSVGKADQSDSEEERAIFADVKLGTLGIKAAASRLGVMRDRRDVQIGKPRTGRPRGPGSKQSSKAKKDQPNEVGGESQLAEPEPSGVADQSGSEKPAEASNLCEDAATAPEDPRGGTNPPVPNARQTAVEDEGFVCEKGFLVPLAGPGKSRPGSNFCGTWFVGLFRPAASKALVFDHKEAKHATEQLLAMFKSDEA